MIAVEYEDTTFQFDMEEVTTEQLVKIQKVYNLDILGLAHGMQSGNIDAMRCILWLMKVQNGSDLLRLETVTITKPVKFAAALMQATLKEQMDLLEKAEEALKNAEAGAPKD